MTNFEQSISRRELLRWSGLAAGAILLNACGGDESSVVRPEKTGATEPITTTTTTEAALPATTTTNPEITRLNQPLPNWFNQGPAEKPFAAITLDDLFHEEDPSLLENMLNICRDKQFKMTFFATGAALDLHERQGRQDLWRRVVAEGHEIGNHTASHRLLSRLSDQDIRNELGYTQDALNRVLGFEYRTRLMRPPGGDGGFSNGGRVVQVANELGYSVAMWSIDASRDGRNEPFRESIVAKTQPGSIVLTHFNTIDGELIGEAVGRIRAEKGLNFRTITGLFAD
jgi:peptidoglycan/xylan/chitin deacetylase (PgdA/CDA1 family)